MPRDVFDRLALAEELLALGEQPDDLLGGVVPSLHCRAVLHPTIVGVGHAQRVDHLKGTRSIGQQCLSAGKLV